MEIVKGSVRKPISADRFIDVVETEFKDEEGVVYVGYPILSTVEEAISVDALIVSRNYGVVPVHLVEGRDIGDYEEIQDELASLLDSKFRQNRGLRKGRKLLVEPNPLSFAPLYQGKDDQEGYRIADEQNLGDMVRSCTWDNPELYEQVLSVIQSISTIRKNRRKRTLRGDSTHGAALQELEDSIANLDQSQSRAVIETVKGVQRIRGLAGSGKTIILALKAAYLHSQNPDWKIAVTFNTRSLKEQFKRLIETFVVEQTGEQPTDNIQILNAWGAPGGDSRTGIYYQFCVANGLAYWDFQQAARSFGYEDAFKGVAENALNEVKNPVQLFDAILVDEAQDFDPAFLKLCYLSLSDDKRLVYAYDELQSLTDSSLPPPEEIFGINSQGVPNVIFTNANESQDIILKKCYRNSRPVLATAHALGFGIYREPDPKLGTGLIQMFDRPELWEEVGYKVVAGRLTDNEHVVLSRTEESSPEFLERPAAIDDLILFEVFDDHDSQAIWLAEQIEKNIKQDELRPEDIIVINPEPKSTKRQVGLVRKYLFDKGILSHLAGVDTSSDVFFQADEASVAFTGIFRAKGNEAGMVYVMNAQDCYSSWNEIGRVRNRLFTAMTRSKAWVRVVGVGEQMQCLKNEYNKISSKDFTLDFIYPDEKLRNRLRIVNRDLSAEEHKRLQKTEQSLADLLEGVEQGLIRLEDLPEEQLAKLRSLLRD